MQGRAWSLIPMDIPGPRRTVAGLESNDPPADSDLSDLVGALKILAHPVFM